MTSLVVEDLTTLMDRSITIGMIKVSVASSDSFELAVTLFTRFPLSTTGEPLASISAWVTTRVAVQVKNPAGARLVPGQDTLVVVLSSTSEIPVSVEALVLVTR